MHTDTYPHVGSGVRSQFKRRTCHFDHCVTGPRDQNPFDFRGFTHKGFPGGSVVKNLPVHARDVGLIPGSGRSSGEGTGNPLQDSCLGNLTYGGAWWATVHGIAKSQT